MLIAEALEDQLSVVDQIEADIERKLDAAKALRQSILHRAFTGQLVPQDPNDEPASELLKRIAAEREARAREQAASKSAARQSSSRTRRAGKSRKTTTGTPA